MAVILLVLLGGVAWKLLVPPSPQEVDLNIKPVDPPVTPKEQAADPPAPLPPLPDASKPQTEQKAEEPPKPTPQPEPKAADQVKVDPAPKPPEPALPAPQPAPTPQPASLPPIEQARAALRQQNQPAEQWAALGDALRVQPDGADAAFLLYRNAASRGHGVSALGAGSFYDPTDNAPKGTIKADAVQAYAWYKRAAEAQIGDALPRLVRLRNWIDREVAAGNADAKEALKQWK
jgi:hypothetical protein